MAKRKSGQFYKHGRYSGWDDYRYGERQEPVTLSKAKPIFKDDRRRQVTEAVAALFNDWRSSPFESEGVVRCSLRSTLCLEGYAWQRADVEASSVVQSAFIEIGAVRPSWPEGQPDATTVGDRCTWCGVMLPDEMLGGGQKSRYCSAEHAKAARVHMAFQQKNSRDLAYAATERIIRKSRMTARRCAICGDAFQPIREASKQVFCSQRCRGIANRSQPDRSCDQCGKLFRAVGSQAHCSSRCYDASGGGPEFHSTCLWCGTAFFRGGTNRAFCCDEHRKRWNGIAQQLTMRRARELTPPVFDYMVHRVGARITDDWRAAA